MEVLTTPAEMRAWRADRRSSGRRLAFVPTMGALHRGHRELIAEAARHGEVVVSIFVNPLQFDRPADFDAYPRPIDDDLEACRFVGVSAVYAPTARAMYSPGFQTRVSPGALAEPLEGRGRPGHFEGVTTVVAKLFNAVGPDVAVFGQKDFQQLAVLRRLVQDLDLGIEIVGLPTVRESDGLALSSRNRRLGSEDRAAAVCIPRGLEAAHSAFLAGERRAAELVRHAEQVFDAEPRARTEYAQLADAESLEAVETVARPAVLAVAVWFGEVRLIDNVLLG